jgi:hypothetical protein
MAEMRASAKELSRYCGESTMQIRDCQIVGETTTSSKFLGYNYRKTTTETKRIVIASVASIPSVKDLESMQQQKQYEATEIKYENHSIQTILSHNI